MDSHGRRTKGNSTTKANGMYEPPDFCAVCGDNATGHHYETPACNGCKNFFQRTVLDQRSFECKKGNVCTIDKKQRVKCRACRFKKCVEAGMNPLALRSEDIPENEMALKLAKRRLNDDCEASTSAEPKKKPVERLSRAMKNAEKEIEHRISFVTMLEEKVDFLRRSTLSAEDHRGLTLQRVLSRYPILGIAQKYETITEWPKCECFLKFKTLREQNPNEPSHYHHWERWWDVAGDKFFKKYKGIIKPKRTGWLFLDMVIVVEYAKAFDFFQRLSDNDKMILACHTVLMCTVFTEAFYSFMVKSDSLIYPDGHFLIKRLKLKGNVPSQLADIICNQSVESVKRLQLDDREYALLKAIMLCHAACDGLSVEGRKLIETERNAFAKALLDYCRRKHGATEGATHFANAVLAIESFLAIAQKHRYFHELQKLKFGKHRTSLIDKKYSKYPIYYELMD